MFQLLLDLLQLGAFSQTLEAPSFQAGMHAAPLFQAEELASGWTNLCSLSTSFYKVKTQEGQKIIPYAAAQFPTREERGILCSQARAKRDWDEQISWIWGIQCSCLQEAITLQTDPEVYAREKERIWLLIQFYDQLLLLIGDSNRRLKILRQLLMKH